MTDDLGNARNHSVHSLIGQQLGPYEVLSLLGIGGMGEVYRARDTRLQRDVAVKVLPHFVADDPERLRRFEREAHLLAALNHSHIGAIYGIEEIGGVRALILELVDGETLAERLRRGPIAVAEALTIASQLADALDAAHEKGIIHRDLKPANIKITTDDIVKVLDFGLAKVEFAEGTAPDLTQSPTTVTAGRTREGVILGTAAYMSPEQARGGPVDKRTDVWAFGCVMYEMLAGSAAFAGETVSDTIASILAREPDWRRLPPSTPAAVQLLLQRCLTKDRRRRLRDIGDARLEIETLRSSSSGSGEAARGISSTLRERRWTAALGLLAILLIGVLGSMFLIRRPAEPAPLDAAPVRRFSLELDYVHPAISPNGRHIAYRSGGRLWIRDLESETPREIPGGKAEGDYYSDTGYYLTWSPDSQYLAFTAENELRRVSVLQGGAVTTICTLPPGRASGRRIAGMAWSSNGDTIVFSRYGAGIYEVPAAAGSPTLLWKEDHADDVLLFDTPRGRAIVFASSTAGHDVVVRTSDGQRRVIAQIETGWPELVYSPSGHLLYRRDPVDAPSIWALPFSPETLTTTGAAFLVERAGQGMSLSQDGTLVYLDTGRVVSQRLAWRDRAGKLLEQSRQMHESIESVAVSPDTRRALITTRDGGTAMWLYDLERLVRTRFEVGPESEGATALFGFFTRSGDQIYYTLQKAAGETAIYAKPADGFGQPRPVSAPDGFKVAQNQSADGRYLVGVCAPCGSLNRQIVVWQEDDVARPPAVVNFSQNSASELATALSPNHRFIAYTSTIGGRIEVYVRPFPDGTGRWQISADGGRAPVWGADGKELFFAEGNALMRVSVSTVGEFSAAAPEPLFEHPTLVFTEVPAARYAVSRDGTRFLTVESERERSTPVVRFVQNWLSEFRRASHSTALPR